MTAIDVRFDVPGPAGRVPARGALLWVPTLRRIADDGAVVLPAPFRVNMTAGAALVEVEPTGLDWVWRVEELVSGAPQRVVYLAVPDSATAVLYSDLVAVDPATLAPEATPEAAWWATAAANVQDGAVVGDDLVLTRQDGSAFVAGNVRGPAGPAGEVTAAELEAALATKADTSGATFSGDVTVSGADLQVSGTGKAYRFRRGGGALDFEGAGADLLFSMWPAADFSGVQRSYDRYSSGELSAQHAGKREFVSAPYGATRHTIDGTANLTGWYGAAPVGRQVVTGSRGGNAALGSLIAALAALGWIDDQTTP
ncbi:minor tail protein [Arthrobacter phage Marchesin]|nr:minor tail protein [Arthrobacter phage Marchesin]